LSRSKLADSAFARLQTVSNLSASLARKIAKRQEYQHFGMKNGSP